MRLIGTFLIAGVMLALPVSAAISFVDPFTDAAFITDAAGGGSRTTGAVAYAGGGFFTTREIIATSDGLSSTTAEVLGGELSLSPNAQTTGSGQVNYTGGTFDFSSMVALSITLNSADFVGGTVMVEVLDNIAGTTGLLDFTGGAGLGVGPNIYSINLVPLSGLIDWGNVTQLRLFIASGPTASNDLVFSNFTLTDVPEPGTMAMLGLGLAILGVSRRFRKNQTEA